MKITFIQRTNIRVLEILILKLGTSFAFYLGLHFIHVTRLSTVEWTKRSVGNKTSLCVVIWHYCFMSEQLGIPFKVSSTLRLSENKNN